MKIDSQGRVNVLLDLAELYYLQPNEQILIGFDGIDLIIVPVTSEDFSMIPIVAVTKTDSKNRIFIKSILRNLGISSTEYYICFVDRYLHIRFTN